MTIAARKIDLADLRALSDRIEQDGADDVLPFGVPAIDRALPGGGLRRGALHEIEGPPGDAAGIGFALALAMRCLGPGSGPILWCQPGSSEPERGPLYGPGLARFGLPPTALVVARPAKARDALWAMEEGLRAGTVAAVVGSDMAPDMVMSRRLQLAAQAHGRLALLLLPRRIAASPSTAVTRWSVASAPSIGNSEKAAARWRLTLRRCRKGRGQDDDWHVIWDAKRSIFVPG